MIILLTGGSGCGKSTFAERLVDAMPKENRIYIATMQVYDEESERRVARHRAQRADKGFSATIERQKDLGSLVLPAGSSVLLEDLPNLLANEMFDGGDWTRIVPGLRALSERCKNLVMVTNDVFSDGVTYAPSTREYLRRMAQVIAGAAALADSVAEVVYSIPVPIKGGLPPCV